MRANWRVGQARRKRAPGGRWRAMALAAGLVVVGLGVPGAPARAQPSSQLDTQLFLPTTGRGNTFTIPRTEVPRHLTFDVGLGLNYELAPLVRTVDGDAVADVVRWRGQAELLAAMGLFEWFELGVAIPAVFARVADDPSMPKAGYTTGFDPGDIRLALKVPLLRGDFGLAARMLFTLPSGNGKRFVGTDYWTYTPSVVASYGIGRLTLSGEAGYRMRRRAVLDNGLEWDDEVHLAAGATVDLTEQLAVVAETQLRVGTGGNELASNEIPMESDFGFRWKPLRGLSIDVGAGTGVLRGYGAPRVRAFTVVRYASERETCAAGPEDFDGFQDSDFCADPDNDGDGLPDEEDECPNDPEDMDGFLDGDGCPDPDNDGDGVLDEEDECPLQSEDKDGFEDADGCPEPDNDDDGVPDGLDDCPMEPEDLDGYEDDDGCPEPGPDQATVTVTDTRILISERIYFDFDRDTIRSVSKPLLDQVADVINDLPSDRRIRVEGYTDSAGNDEYNVDLSYRRARAVVEYLVGRGVSRDRIGYVGYGAINPVAPNDTADGRALNRRVEFTILQPGERMHPGKGRSGTPD